MEVAPIMAYSTTLDETSHETLQTGCWAKDLKVPKGTLSKIWVKKSIHDMLLFMYRFIYLSRFKVICKKL